MRSSITLFDDQYKFYKAFKSEKLLIAFVEYMFENIEPEGLSEQEKILFDSLRVRMDNQKKKARAGASSHGGGRKPKATKTTTEKQQKNNKTTTKQQQEEDISYDILRDTSNDVSKDKEEVKVITLSNDNEEEKPSFGNEEINKCLELIKTYNNGIVDGTQQNQRRFARHLIKKLNGLENVKKGKFTRYETLDILLKIISQNKFYCTKITSPEKIYRELGTLMSVCKKDIQDKSTESIVLETL